MYHVFHWSKFALATLHSIFSSGSFKFVLKTAGRESDGARAHARWKPLVIDLWLFPVYMHSLFEFKLEFSRSRIYDLKSI